MKKNDWILLVCTLVYSYLFYQQSAGLNFFLFNIGIVAVICIRNRELIKDKVWLSVAVSALFSSFFIFIYSCALAIVANLFSLAVLSAISMHRQTSFITGIFLSIASVTGSAVFMFIDWTERKSKRIMSEYHRPFHTKLFMVLIPVLIALLFFILYRAANPLFNDFTKDINLEWISFGWIFFTLGGFLMLYGFFYNRNLKDVIEADTQASVTLTEQYVNEKGFLNKLMRTDTENTSGILLFSLLNGLLLMVNLLDLNYLWADGSLPAGMKHKEFVHDGVGILIFSLILAILIILFYFRGGMNFYEKNKWIKTLAFAWILQNAFMIFSTAYRNDLYIQESGLSYKKIGVYVYLLLVLIGLAITYIKLVKKKSNWYMFRTNAAVYFYVLVFSCAFNWDMIITQYNINKFKNEGKVLEKYLLLDLSFKNIPLLLALPDSEASRNDWEARDYYYELRGTYYNDFKSSLHKKLYDYMCHIQFLKWQSACLEKNRVKEELSLINPTLKELHLQHSGLTSLWPLKEMKNVEYMNLSGCRLKNAKELLYFKKLKSLDISENCLNSISPLYSMKQLQHLRIGNISSEQSDTLKKHLPNTKIIWTSGATSRY